MEGQINSVDNINTSINEIENYIFKNKQNRYNNLKVITDYLRSELSNLTHEFNEIERNKKIAKIEATVNTLIACFKTYEFPTASIDENTGEIIVKDDKRLINSSVTQNDSQMLENIETIPKSSITSPLESANVANASQFVNYPNTNNQTVKVGGVANQEITSIPIEVPQISIFDDEEVTADKVIDINNNPQSFEYRPVENMNQAQDLSQEYAKEIEAMPLDEQALDTFLNGNSGLTI